MNRTKSLNPTDSRAALNVHPTNGRRRNGAAGSRSPQHDENKLLQLVPEDGSPIGNKQLRTRLSWEAADYFVVRDRLVESEVLSIGRGRGGSVYRVEPIPTTKAPKKAAKPFKRERDLYKPVEEALREGWSKTLRNQDYLVQITANKGRKATGGMWTRPDITVVFVHNYPYVPGKFIEVITYEIKPEGGWDVAGVFETASHSRFATQSYLLIHAPDGSESIPEEKLERLQKECARFKIGLGLFHDPSSYDTYDFPVDPERRQPDPEEMNRFIEQQLSGDNKKRILRMQ